MYLCLINNLIKNFYFVENNLVIYIENIYLKNWFKYIIKIIRKKIMKLMKYYISLIMCLF